MIRSFFRSSERFLPTLLRSLKRRYIPVDVLYGRDFLFNLIPKKSVGVEIGVYRGDFSQSLLENIQPSKLTLIDPWMPFEMQGDQVYDTELSRMDRRYLNVCRRFRSERETGSVQVIRLSSGDAACLFETNSLDWIYVDGDHRESAVRSDISSYWSKLKSGGLMIFDDYQYDQGWQDGVTKACDAVLPTLDGERIAQEAHQLVVRKS